MMMDADNATLVMIDYQPRLLPAIHHGQKLVARSVTLGRIAALLDVPVIGTEQSPDKLGENVPSIKRLCTETLAKSRFEVFVVEDAVGARRRADKAAALARMSQAGVTLVTLEMVAFEWLGDAGHPRFKDVQALIK